FRTIVVCEKGREKTYARHYKARGGFGVVDEVLLLPNFKDVLGAAAQKKLRAANAVFVPHRSFQVYLDFDYGAIENKFEVPILGSRMLLRAEERTSPRNQYFLLEKAGVPSPKKFKSAKEIDRVAIVKAGEAQRKFERAFFLAASEADFKKKAAEMIEKGLATKESFVVGAQVNANYFYSPLEKRLELMGTDARRQTNIDGFLRLPAPEQAKALEYMEPKYEEAGHYAVTILESMVEQFIDYGEKFAAACAREYAPGIVGPFALQGAVKPGPPKKEFVVFDASLRMPGSPGTKYTPYSEYLFGESVSVGRRLAMELRKAVETSRLEEVVT
ncbi:MAG: DUF1297 domain-containing protein, partial [Candidatus Micrarchaeota archaeon]|nr:DUF1297 domain-containing protein [Candidatus Micrarchaeota archaeon]